MNKFKLAALVTGAGSMVLALVALERNSFTTILDYSVVGIMYWLLALTFWLLAQSED